MLRKLFLIHLLEEWIGYKPKISVEEGVRRFANWFLNIIPENCQVKEVKINSRFVNKILILKIKGRSQLFKLKIINFIFLSLGLEPPALRTSFVLIKLINLKLKNDRCSICRN